MRYRDKGGIRRRESTLTEDWGEAQKCLRERLQARDNNTLPALRRGQDLRSLENGRTFTWRTFPSRRFARKRLTGVNQLGIEASEKDFRNY